jgi:hypothetical protein
VGKIALCGIKAPAKVHWRFRPRGGRTGASRVMANFLRKGPCGAILGLAAMMTAALSMSPSAASAGAAAVPDFSGSWMRTGNAFDFARPLPGASPGPLINISGNDLIPIGNADSPILKPWAAAEVRKHNEIILAGKLALDAPASCMLMGVPYVLQVRENVWLAQEPARVTIVYQNDNQWRHVYLGASHSANPTPSWFGESIGHYDGDALVVDTTAIAVHEFSAIDRFGTPHTEAMHVVERYRVAPDRRSLRVDFTVDDAGAFNMPWHAAVVYSRGTSYPGERPCAENNREGMTGIVPMPVASKSDF